MVPCMAGRSCRCGQDCKVSLLALPSLHAAWGGGTCFKDHHKSRHHFKAQLQPACQKSCLLKWRGKRKAHPLSLSPSPKQRDAAGTRTQLQHNLAFHNLNGSLHGLMWLIGKKADPTALAFLVPQAEGDGAESVVAVAKPAKPGHIPHECVCLDFFVALFVSF